MQPNSRDPHPGAAALARSAQMQLAHARSAEARLAKAQIVWRRAADELLIDAIFNDLSSVRRDDCTGRRMRQVAFDAALGAPHDQPAGAKTQNGAPSAPSL